jgi:DNA-directed RNA polymerase I and III subunit RPAC2
LILSRGIHFWLKLALTDKINVQDVLEKGLDDLSDLCDVVIEKFTAARDEYHTESKTS